ncbi:MAG: PilZ domain-containing protein, partial [Pseudomonadota bacterium]
VENLSQQGARFSSSALFAIDQTVRIKAADPSAQMPEVRAKIRWRRDEEYGVVFDDTLSLADFARLAARVQCPALLD